jgi:hypothetical protein
VEQEWDPAGCSDGTQPGAGVVVSPGRPLGRKAITGDEYLRVELAAVEVSLSGLAGRRAQSKSLMFLPRDRSPWSA